MSMNVKKFKASGLNALIPIKNKKKPKKKKASVFYIEIRKIRQSPEMLKKEIDQAGLKELTDSIRKYGIVEPLTVAKVEKRKRGGGLNVYYKLVSGRKRLMAAKSAGLAVVPAVIKNEAYDKV